MRISRHILRVLLAVSVLYLTTGCSLDDGFQDGLQAGVSGALAALIQTPIEAALDDTFNDSGD